MCSDWEHSVRGLKKNLFQTTKIVLFKDRLKTWRGKLSLKEAAAVLGIDYPSYRKYETGKRTPCKLALAQIEAMMKEPTK